MTPCIRFNNAIVTYSNVYRYKGYYFEWHGYSGPWPLKKDGDLRKNIPSGFWDMIDEFIKLTKKEKEKYLST